MLHAQNTAPSRQPRLKQVRKPLIVSSIPATAISPASRPISIKRLSRVRMSWFVVGSLFGVGVSFFMSTLVSTVVIPAYEKYYVNSTVSVAQAPTATPDTAPVDTAKAPADAAPETKTAAAEPAKPEVTYPQKLALKLGRGESLLDILVAHRVPLQEAKNVINALKSKYNPQKLQTGQQISVTLARHEVVGDGAAVRELAIKLPNLDTIALQRLDSGQFNVAETKDESAAKALRRFGKVRSSLSQAANDAGIPNSAMAEILKAYSYDVDFQREIHPGDTIEVLMEKKAEKSNATFGPPRYAMLTLRGKKHEIFRFKNAFGDYAWFDEKGNNVKKSLIRTPLSVAHITSGFGMRNHPLLGYTKMHKGVDFGAATGTPIMAAGDGTVEFKGWKSGYGNFVILKHNNTYETAYGHMSRFANISEGNRVKQGQVIGYVGMTGAATGPHLHYEVRQNNAQVNPVSKQFNLANGLTGKQLAAFTTARQSAMNELLALAGGNPAKAAKKATASAGKPAKTAKATKSQKLASR